MNKEKQKIVPELRFPEFKNDGDWEIRSVEKNIDMISGIALKSKELSEDKSGTPILRGINITEGHIRHSQKIDRFYIGDTTKINKYLVDENDIVIGMDGSKVGKNVALVSKLDIGSILIQRVARIRAIDSDIKYLYQNFIYQRFITYVDNVNTSSGIPHISSKQIKDFIIGFPPKVKEQQKIANCLSSLDNLISAEKDKLDLLKNHKKGLLQQLFPAKGETKPQFRFPEFENDGDWDEKTLGDISEITTGTSNRQDSTEEEGEYTFFDRSQDIRTSNRFLFDGEAIIVAGEGQEFKPKYFIGKFDLHQRAYAILDFNDNIFGKFLYYSIYKNRSYFLRYAVGSTVKSLRLPIFENMPTLIPFNLKEQEKIADCLSSADDLIEAQKTKIENLKSHKKGLMQQLFPAIN